jgi:3-phenylpropionate/trans-cinnamate dioxygenase ferredoxin reductase subunit
VRRIVIVGGSLGGLRAAESVRRAGFTDEVLVIGAERWMPYDRPPLSKQLLAGQVEPESLEFPRRRSIQDVRWLLGVPVTGIDLDAQVVTLADGQELGWDGLVAATGLRPRRLDLPGPSVGRHALRAIEDATSLRAELVPGARVVVIGAGFIGCEVAATARGLGCSVQIVAPESEPLERALGVLVGAVFRARHEQHGVGFHLGRLPVGIEPAPGADRVGAVRLDDGTVLPADVVVEAVGCLPNVEWLRDTGLDLTDGVRTDGWLRAISSEGRACPHVVAVGDLARFPNALVDEVPRRVEHWSVPTETARRAGPALVAGLTGTPLSAEPFRPVPSFWSDQYGLRLQSFGTLVTADEVRLLQGDPAREFVAGYFRSGQLLGVAGIESMPELLRLRAEISHARKSATRPPTDVLGRMLMTE